MHRLESRWIGDHLARLPDERLFPLLDIGSSTNDFRTRVQPYLEQNIYAPLRARGGRVFHAMKRSLGAGEWVRRGLGAAVLVAVVAIALGLDTGFLTQASLANTASLEQSLLDRLNPPAPAMKPSVVMTNNSKAGTIEHVYLDDLHGLRIDRRT